MGWLLEGYAWGGSQCVDGDPGSRRPGVEVAWVHHPFLSRSFLGVLARVPSCFLNSVVHDPR